ncbi:MAG: alginate export family protein, partial [Myxococcales bacterium]|nr:alginate export family protein [Myxococcales bacterium]
AGADSDDVDAFAYHLDAELGVNVADDRVRIAGEGLLASGDDPSTTEDNEAYDHLFPTAHKWLGFSDIIGARSNVGSGVLHLVFKASEQVKLTADGHIFLRPQPTAATGNDGYAGAEVDLGGVYAIGGGLKTRLGWAIFLPDEDHYGTTDPAHFVEAELRYDLK